MTSLSEVAAQGRQRLTACLGLVTYWFEMALRANIYLPNGIVRYEPLMLPIAARSTQQFRDVYLFKIQHGTECTYSIAAQYVASSAPTFSDTSRTGSLDV